MFINPVEEITVKITRALLALDGKDHFIIRTEDYSVFADTTDPRIIRRSKWCIDEDIEQYWTANLETKAKTGGRHITLVKRVRKNLHWEDDPEKEIQCREQIEQIMQTKKVKTK